MNLFILYYSIMADTGALSPWTMASDELGGTAAWINPNNAKVSDNAYAIITLSSEISRISRFLNATNFGFSIPAGAIINGILVEIERKANYSDANSEVFDFSINLRKADGTIGITNKSTGATWFTIESYVSFGSSSDLWGETWASTDINDVDFGVAIRANIDNSPDIGDLTASIDHIRITVYYTASGVPNSPWTMADDSAVWTVAWTNPNNAKVSDNVYATASDERQDYYETIDYTVNIIKSNGAIGATNLANFSNYPIGSDAYHSYGSSSNLWGESWSASDINNSNFGVAITISDGNNNSIQSHYLKATNFGFTIPTGATINGILVEREGKQTSSSTYGVPGSFGIANIDHIRIAVYYTEGYVPKISLRHFSTA